MGRNVTASNKIIATRYLKHKEVHYAWLFLDDIAAKTGFMVTEKGERAFQGTFYAARFLLNEQDF